MTGIGVSSGPVGCLTFSTVVAPCRWATAEEEDEREEEEAATTEKLPSVVRVPFGVRVYGLRFSSLTLSPQAAEEEDEKEEEELPTTKKVTQTEQDWEQLNTQNAIWLRSPSDVSAEEYEKFYQAISKVRRCCGSFTLHITCHILCMSCHPIQPQNHPCHACRCRRPQLPSGSRHRLCRPISGCVHMQSL